jgi:S-disulfanyl-L-cysteine oxidoreductase SoxD
MGSTMRRSVLLIITLGVCQFGWAQSPTYKLGKTPTADEIRAWDIAISPTGKELPPGKGTAKEGAQIYVRKGCAGCHGPTGAGGRAPVLIVAKGAPTKSGGEMAGMDMGIQPPGLMAVSMPYPTVMWDYISRGMPLGKEGSLTPDEVYSLTAFLLYKNDVIHSEDEVLDNQSLPKLKVPGSEGVKPPPGWKPREPRLPHYPE